MKLSIIIPVLNESEAISRVLPTLAWATELGHELIVVDGGSSDGSADLARHHATQVLASAPGRARQMNAGAQCAHGDVLLFLHVDTRLNQECVAELCRLLPHSNREWGRYDVSLSGRQKPFRVIETLMNWRSRLTGIATGDQAIFIKKDLFQKIGGYADLPLMEDIEISRRLKRIGKPLCLSPRVITSSRRWEQQGILATISLMWRLRYAYWRGADPQALANQYHK